MAKQAIKFLLNECRCEIAKETEAKTIEKMWGRGIARGSALLLSIITDWTLSTFENL